MSKKSFKGGLDSLIGGAKKKEPGIKALVLQNRDKVVGKGRPRTNFKEPANSSQQGTKEGETRATFIVREDSLEKLKAVAYWDRVSIKDVLRTALQEYIERYEKKNGTIKPAPKH